MLAVIPLSLAAICAYTDLRTNLIPNKITLPLILSGLAYSALTGRIVISLSGLAIGAGIFLVPVVMGGVGGGDLKLAAALGTWLGINILPAIFIACVIGLAWGVARLYQAGQLKSRMIALLRGAFFATVYGMRTFMPVSKMPEDDNVPLPPEAIPFGVCLACGTWIVLIALILQGAGVKVV